MTRTRFLALLLTVALALASTTAAMAQEESPAADEGSMVAFDPSGLSEADQDEALISYLILRNQLLEAGVAEGDLGAAAGWLEGEVQNLSEEDIQQLLVMQELGGTDDEEEASDG